jgi:hypothetical protein
MSFLCICASLNTLFFDDNIWYMLLLQNKNKKLMLQPGTNYEVFLSVIKFLLSHLIAIRHSNGVLTCYSNVLGTTGTQGTATCTYGPQACYVIRIILKIVNRLFFHEFRTEFGWELPPHPPYSPDLAPSDYHIISTLLGLNNLKKQNLLKIELQ